MGIERERANAAVCAVMSGQERGWYLAKVAKLEAGELAVMALNDDIDDQVIVGYLKAALGECTVSSAAPTLEPLRVQFILQTGKNAKQTVEHHFAKPPTLSELEEVAEQVYPWFVHEAFRLHMGRVTIQSQEQWQGMWQDRKRKSLLRIAVVSMRKPFTSYNKKDAPPLLGLGRGVTESRSLYKDNIVCDTGANLPDCITKKTGWKTVQDVLDHVARDLAFRSFFSSPMDIVKEASARELISPILLAALACASSSSSSPEFQLQAECQVDGAQAAGSIDWVLAYDSMSIVVVEAKLHSKWEEHLGQLAAEIVGSREEFAMKRLGKRKAEVAEVMSQLPSWGILTTGLAYKFYKYLQDAQREKVLLQSVTAELALGSKNAEQVRDAAKPIIAFIADILKEQKACLDGHPEVKRARCVGQV